MFLIFSRNQKQTFSFLLRVRINFEQLWNAKVFVYLLLIPKSSSSLNCLIGIQSVTTTRRKPRQQARNEQHCDKRHCRHNIRLFIQQTRIFPLATKIIHPIPYIRHEYFMAIAANFHFKFTVIFHKHVDRLIYNSKWQQKMAPVGYSCIINSAIINFHKTNSIRTRDVMEFP